MQLGRSLKCLVLLFCCIGLLFGNSQFAEADPKLKSKPTLTSSINSSKQDSIKCVDRKTDLMGSPLTVYKDTRNNLDASRPIKVLIYAIDFINLNSNSQALPNYSTFLKNISSYFQNISRDKIEFVWTVSKSYARMKSSIASYDSSSRFEVSGIIKIIKEAQEKAFDTYNLKEFDYFVAATPPNTKVDDISTTISYLKNDSNYLNSTILGGDFWQSRTGWSLIAHEIGHAFGLVDLYDLRSLEGPVAKSKFYLDQFQFLGFFDLMNWPTGPAPELTAWNRWMLGFISDQEIRCISGKATIESIAPIESDSTSLKALFFRLSNSELMVIENRASIGFDNQLPADANGLIVYIVNFDIDSGDGPIRLITKNGRKTNFLYDSVLQSGDRLNTSQIYIENLGRTLNGDIRVRVLQS